MTLSKLLALLLILLGLLFSVGIMANRQPLNGASVPCKDVDGSIIVGATCVADTGFTSETQQTRVRMILSSVIFYGFFYAGIMLWRIE